MCSQSVCVLKDWTEVVGTERKVCAGALEPGFIERNAELPDCQAGIARRLNFLVSGFAELLQGFMDVILKRIAYRVELNPNRLAERIGPQRLF